MQGSVRSSLRRFPVVGGQPRPFAPAAFLGGVRQEGEGHDGELSAVQNCPVRACRINGHGANQLSAAI